MPTGPFIGSSLFLLSVNQTTISTLRVRFSQDPVAANPGGATDALNPANYTLTGPGANSVQSVGVISADPQGFNVNLTVPLIDGEWTLTVANIETSTGDPLTPPTSIAFTASDTVSIPSISGGAISETSESILRKHLNPALKGRGWDALIAGLAVGDTYLRDLAALAFKQLFKSTASGKYLDRKAADDGFIRPAGVGVSDEVFRQLAIKIAAEKLTLQSFLNVLEAYYGSDATRATIDTTAFEPYALQEGDDLIVDIDGEVVIVVFHDDDFSATGQGRAIEVASAITRGLQQSNKTRAYAKPIVDVTSGDNLVRIYSGALGLRGTIRVLGGRAQNILRFPTILATTQAIGTQWQIDTPATLPALEANRSRYTFIGGTNPTLQLVHIGDIANIYGTPFNVNNRGAFEIVAVSTTYFEVVNLNAVDEATVTQIAADDILFFRPTRFTINSKDRFALAAQGNVNYTDIILAATTQAVSRQPFKAAYLHSNAAISFRDISSAVSMARTLGTTVTVETTEAHGFSTGETFYLAPGDPQAGQEFNEGIHTVNTVPDSTHFTYLESGPNVSAALPQFIYPSYREEDGTVTLKTSSAHGLSGGQFLIFDNLRADIDTHAPIHAKIENTGLASPAGYLRYYGGVVLQDGRVLVCGGTNGANSALVNIFDPTTDTWAAGAAMNVARSKHTATLLNNGRVLVTGGNEGAPLSSAELYDPDLDTWIVAASMAFTRWAHTATLLNDGRVLVNGGATGAPAAAQAAEIYNPSTGLWTTVATPAFNRNHSQAVKITDGSVLTFGGHGGTTAFPTNTSEFYNPINNTWTTTGNMTSNRFEHQAVWLDNVGTSGKVFATGGFLTAATSLATTELYNPPTRTWASAASFATARGAHGMTILSDKNVLIHGGANGGVGGTELDESSVYYPLANQWISNVFTGPSPRDGHRIFLLSDKRVLLGQSIDTGFAVLGQPEVLYLETVINSSGGLDGIYEVEVTGPSEFTYTTTNESDFTNLSAILTEDASAWAISAAEDLNHIGPYIYDTTNGPAITGASTTLAQDIDEGQNYSSILVANAGDFPADGGFLVFGFGTDIQVFPVKYNVALAAGSPDTLLIDSSFVFPKSLPAGTSVILLQKRGIFVPDNPEDVGSFYLTDSIAGRIAASSTIDQIAAAGVEINKTVVYPGDIGLANAGQPTSGVEKISDIVYIYGTDDEVVTNREDE